jgi:predicted transglutaminase-like cysteine proteinase
MPPISRTSPRDVKRNFERILVVLLTLVPPAVAGTDAPAWMHAVTAAPVSAYDEKVSAVVLYSDTTVTVLSENRIRRHVREVYKVLRPEGRERGRVAVYFNPSRKITSLHAWCIPAQGKDYEVKEKDAIELAAPAEGGYLVNDTRYRVLNIPAPDPGNIVGYEYEVEEQPFWLQDVWFFQTRDPVRESHYSLQLPAGWVFKASWLSHEEVKPDESGSTLQWSLTDIREIRPEPDMPPWQGLAGQMVVSFFPAGGSSQKNAFTDWQQMGQWYANLVGGRMDASDAIKKETATLVSGKNQSLQKMRSIAQFVQHDIRYVAISLGIGGWQPHAAPDVFLHRYGDCKDKATLMRTMLREVGIDSYHVVINSERGSIVQDSPPHNAFDHVIVAIKLPDDVQDPSLVAVIQHPKLGRILFFDPTNEFIPLGQIGGYLQDNYGLLVTADGGELVKLPEQPAATSGVQRVANLTLNLQGTLTGDVRESRLGDRAAFERATLRDTASTTDKLKPIETVLSGSLSNFQVTKASLINANLTDQALGLDYTFQSLNYARPVGNLVLVRPRVLGIKSSGILETKEPRKFAVEFGGPERDTDTFDIALPPGYVVDELPPPVDVDYSFASYHSKTEASGHSLHYTRTMEIKELSVPIAKINDLKKFYRIVATDEHNTVVLKMQGGPQ